MGSAYRFLCQKMLLFSTTLCFSVLLPLFGFITTYIFRFKRSDNWVKTTNSNFSLVTSEANNQNQSISTFSDSESEAKQDVLSFSDSGSDGFEEKETPNFSFTFKFPSFEEFSRNNGGNLSPIMSEEKVPTTSTSKYEFMPGLGISQVMEEPEVSSFNVKELNSDTNGSCFGDKDSVQDGNFPAKDLIFVGESVHKEVPENSISDSWSEEVPEIIEAMTVEEEKEEELNAEDKLLGDEDHLSDEIPDSESVVGSSNLHSIMNRFVDTCSDGFLSDDDFGGEFEYYGLMEKDGENLVSSEEFSDSDNSCTRHESDDYGGEDSDILQELRKLEEANLENAETFDSEFLSEKDFHEEAKDVLDKFEEPNSKNLSGFDSEDSNKLETLWEHQDLIEQLKMELKKVRATGLPTILEESECPKIMEDLKPWKIDEKFQHEDPMDELHKFYKGYRERMRKFDILNYQKMYAIGFLQLKDPLQSISSQKSPAPSSITLSSLFSPNFSLYKRKKSESDPMMKFIRELRGDLEVVYVGQMCLSWEILHWQYGKALELWESDPRGIRQYNEVAGEFQQFQVLVERFIEDEPFQGPRVQNYVKNRCVLRNLLQIPVIREDSKDRKKARRKDGDEYAITTDMLVEIMEESIRIFWRFVRADKDCTNLIRRAIQVELQDPADTQILMEVRTNLQKKEKKLKDLLRSGNCILKRFKKCQEDDSDQVLYFFSQVDMKLVSRVLNMSRITTEQLVWCHNKLSKISFVNRKINVEPSFLLFPC